MANTPKLDLPQRRGRKPRSGSGMIIALLLVLVVLQAVSLLMGRREGPAPVTPGGELLTAEDHKALALRLEDKNLSAAAAEAWAAYLQEANLTGAEAGKVLIRIGKLSQDAGKYEDAIHEYYLAETLLDNTDEETSRTIAMRIRECFRKLGQYGELAREMAERAGEPADDGTMTGRQVVAEIGAEKITLAEFDRLLQHEVELAVESQLGLTPEEADAFRQRAHARFADPQAKARQLQQIVLTRVLADAAREQGLDESPEYRQRITAQADSMLASTLMVEEISRRASVTPEDVERFFETHKQRYAEPATTTIARILCKTQEEAREVLAKVQAGEPFESLAKEQSQDPATREAGGVIDQPVNRDGDFVPGFGRDAALHDSLWAAAPGDVLDEPHKTNGAWAVIKVVARSEGRQRTLDEVRDQVEYDTRLARRQEVTQQYIRELFEKARVRLYPEVFSTQAAQADHEPK